MLSENSLQLAPHRAHACSVVWYANLPWPSCILQVELVPNITQGFGLGARYRTSFIRKCRSYTTFHVPTLNTYRRLSDHCRLGPIADRQWLLHPGTHGLSSGRVAAPCLKQQHRLSSSTLPYPIVREAVSTLVARTTTTTPFYVVVLLLLVVSLSCRLKLQRSQYPQP